MSDETALLAAIQRDPEDDTVRLAYADWLDENPKPGKECPECKGGGRIEYSRRCNFCGGDGLTGDYHSLRTCVYCKGAGAIVGDKCPTCKGTGTVPDAGNADRAEFIRLCVSSPHGQNAHRILDLIRLYPEWRPKCPACVRGCEMEPKIHGPGCSCCTACSGTGRVGEFRRGFLEVVRVQRLTTVLEERITCEVCGDSRSPHGRHYCYVLSCESPRLKREWHPTAWARDELAPFLAHVTHVYLGDSGQYLGGPGEGGYWWRDDVVYGHAPRLPEFLCPKWVYYTADAANTALAKCVADELRAQLCGAG